MEEAQAPAVMESSAAEENSVNEMEVVESERGGENESLADSEGASEDDANYRDEILDMIRDYIVDASNMSTFAAGGEITTGIPSVIVEGVERIAYPLCAPQFAVLLNFASQAPFGKGTETVVDTTVRKVWQIESNLVTINPHWMSNSLPKIVAECCAKLGIDAAKMKVQAHLYKLLIYEEGGHFKKHKDTEKEPGMFGSLLIQLPAEHVGGALVVAHQGKAKRFEFAKETGDRAYYASFYTDCDHKLEPVTKGLRLVLAFNLVREMGPNAIALAPPGEKDSKRFEDVLVTATKQWCSDEDAVEKLAYPLSHKYTHTNMTFNDLKGVDSSKRNLC